MEPIGHLHYDTSIWGASKYHRFNKSLHHHHWLSARPVSPSRLHDHSLMRGQPNEFECRGSKAQGRTFTSSKSAIRCGVQSHTFSERGSQFDPSLNFRSQGKHWCSLRRPESSNGKIVDLFPSLNRFDAWAIVNEMKGGKIEDPVSTACGPTTAHRITWNASTHEWFCVQCLRTSDPRSKRDDDVSTGRATLRPRKSHLARPKKALPPRRPAWVPRRALLNKMTGSQIMKQWIGICACDLLKTWDRIWTFNALPWVGFQRFANRH